MYLLLPSTVLLSIACAIQLRLLCVCALLSLQFAYMMLVGTFPFNSFLAGLLCSLAFFSLTGVLQQAWKQQLAAQKQQLAVLYRNGGRLRMLHVRWNAGDSST
jgi:hypothetical protein